MIVYPFGIVNVFPAAPTSSDSINLDPPTKKYWLFLFGLAPLAELATGFAYSSPKLYELKYILLGAAVVAPQLLCPFGVSVPTVKSFFVSAYILNAKDALSPGNLYPPLPSGHV